MSNELRCDDCGSAVTLGRTDHGTLQVACDCHDQPTRVSKALPEGWSA